MSDLRERRRAETLREISDAALLLFESQGAAATTVDQIAEAAGVSPRTYFRYFPRKEDAAFWNAEYWSEIRAAELVDLAAEAIRAGAEPVSALESVFSQVLMDFDKDDEARKRFLRHRRLVRVDGALLSVALQREAVLREHVVDQLRAAIRVDATSPVPQAAVDLAMSVFRVTLDEWARLQDINDDVELLEVHRRVLDVAQHWQMSPARTINGEASPPKGR